MSRWPAAIDFAVARRDLDELGASSDDRLDFLALVDLGARLVAFFVAFVAFFAALLAFLTVFFVFLDVALALLVFLDVVRFLVRFVLALANLCLPAAVGLRLESEFTQTDHRHRTPNNRTCAMSDVETPYRCRAAQTEAAKAHHIVMHNVLVIN